MSTKEQNKRRREENVIILPDPESPAFVVREVVKNGIKMFGVFATRTLEAKTFVGTYEGNRIDTNARQKFLKTLPVEQRRLHQAYDMDDHLDLDIVISPVDENGEILKKFQDCIPLYLNEASEKGETPNVQFCPNVTSHGSVDAVVVKTIPKGRELLTYYGPYVDRTWSLWWIEKGKGLEVLPKKDVLNLQEGIMNKRQKLLDEKEKNLRAIEKDLLKQQQVLDQREAELKKKFEEIGEFKVIYYGP